MLRLELSNGDKKAEVDQGVSNYKSVLSGIPHGSLLGYILFLICTNYMEGDSIKQILVRHESV